VWVRGKALDLGTGGVVAVGGEAGAGGVGGIHGLGRGGNGGAGLPGDDGVVRVDGSTVQGVTQPVGTLRILPVVRP
jgi:hypothetical protein